MSSDERVSFVFVRTLVCVRLVSWTISWGTICVRIFCS